MRGVIHINPKDTVVTCLRPFKKGESFVVDGKTITVNMDIAVFHKVAVTDMREGELCYKYGQVIGGALLPIAAGDHVHEHNIESTRGRGDKRA